MNPLTSAWYQCTAPCDWRRTVYQPTAMWSWREYLVTHQAAASHQQDEMQDTSPSRRSSSPHAADGALSPCQGTSAASGHRPLELIHPALCGVHHVCCCCCVLSQLYPESVVDVIVIVDAKCGFHCPRDPSEHRNGSRVGNSGDIMRGSCAVQSPAAALPVACPAQLTFTVPADRPPADTASQGSTTPPSLPFTEPSAAALAAAATVRVSDAGWADCNGWTWLTLCVAVLCCTAFAGRGPGIALHS
jgi:hypothetical protein